MEKKNVKDNTLIKRKNLILRMKERGIKRISPDAIYLLEEYLEGNLDNIIGRLKEKLTIKGSKTLKKEDIKQVLSKTKESYWEI